jgi:glutamyl-tRNA synthetase
MSAEQSKGVITRYPPSPSGNLHAGAARTALFNYLYAKKYGGKIILRFEDTDKARSKKEFEQNMFEGFSWLGINYDAIFHQSERVLVYRKYLEKMLSDGTAYYSETSTASEFNQGQEDEDDEEATLVETAARVIRFKNPKKPITFADSVRGDITVDTTELGDFIIARSIEEPLYHFAVVVDDFEMGITHVIRGEDGIYNTPRQILIQEAIGAPRPTYCHIPFVLGEDKKKLSKRNGSKPVSDYKKMGILPEALLNYLALLGWNPGTEQEIFTVAELISTFDINKVQKAGAIFDEEKLRWVNREHLKKMSMDNFKQFSLNFISDEIQKLPQWSKDRLDRVLPEIRERITVGSDIVDMISNDELQYFFRTPVYEKTLLIPQGKKSITNPSELKDILLEVKEKLLLVDQTSWNTESIKGTLWDFSSEKGRGNVLWPMRVALSGKDRSPDPFTLSFILGKDETIARLDTAIANLS